MFFNYHRLVTFILLGILLVSPSILANSDSSATFTTNTDNTADVSSQDMERFTTVMAQVQHYYVEPVDNKKLINYAIAGMLASLDPHSDFLDEDALKDLETTTTGKFGGIGIEILPSEGFIKVISPIDDTPAARAGIKAGDLILRINHKIVRDMTLREAIDLIRGQPGTKVQLTILRSSVKKPLELEVPREFIKIQSIKTELLPENYGYIRLSFFQSSSKVDLLKGIQQLQQKTGKTPLKGVILDLRNNPGGLLDAAIETTELFLDSKHLKYNGLIVYTKSRVPSSDIKAFATGKDKINGIPLVVLINEGSASAAEIMAGALKDQGRATIVGQKSFGKGSVQTILGVDDKSALKLTTALYYTPAGRSIQAKGIKPDIEIPELTIPQPATDNDPLISIAEADLEKHLNNQQDTDNEDNDTKEMEQDKMVISSDQKKNQDLLYSDFQLYEALNILKGLYVKRIP